VDQKWWNGIPTIQAKTTLALNAVSGIMIWEIGQDAFGSNIQYSLLRAIDELVDAATVGVSVQDPKALEIFPNPVRDRISIVLPEKGNLQLLITDMSGRVMLNQVRDQTEHEAIEVRDFPAGIYSISVATDSGLRSGRFVKID
jgi:hypothetical protein